MLWGRAKAVFFVNNLIMLESRREIVWAFGRPVPPLIAIV